MLEDACYDCNVPLMRSKKGEMLCLGCNTTYVAPTNALPLAKKEEVV